MEEETETETLARVEGTGGDDSLRGNSSDELLRGFGGNDDITAAGGDDRIDGGTGFNIVAGGDGNDDFVFNEPSSAEPGIIGASRIVDFTVGEDRILINKEGIDSFDDLIVRQLGDNVLIGIGNEAIIINGISELPMESIFIV